MQRFFLFFWLLFLTACNLGPAETAPPATAPAASEGEVEAGVTTLPMTIRPRPTSLFGAETAVPVTLDCTWPGSLKVKKLASLLKRG